MFFDYVLIVILILGFSCIKSDEDVFSINASNALKVVMTIIVFLHHLSQVFVNIEVLQIFRGAGVLAVALFFLISGYGLMYSLRKYERDGKNYLANYITHRLGSIVGPYIIVCVIFQIYNYLQTGQFYSFRVSELLLHGAYFVPYSWYFFAIFYFYLCFYIVGKISRSQIWIIIGITVFTLGYYLWTVSHDFEFYWYNVCFAFPVGILLGSSAGEWFKKIAKKYFFLTSLFMFTIYYVFKNANVYLVNYDFELGGIPMYPILATAFACFMIILFQKLNFKSAIMKKISSFTYSAFLMQGFSMTILRNDHFYIRHDLYYFVLVLCLNFLLGFFVQYTYQQMIRFASFIGEQCKQYKTRS